MRLPVTDVGLLATSHDTTPDVALRRGQALQVRSHGRTDPGRVRSRNEDQFLIADLSHALQARQSSLSEPDVQYSVPRGHLFVVADGVGGHARGDKASALAVNSVEAFILDTLSWCAKLRGEDDRLLGDFQHALERADAKLFREARRRPELHGMATTLTLAYCVVDECFVAHVGDSRCYLLRNGTLYRLTHDHTLVDELVRRGMMKPEEAEQHRYRHVVTNVVGGNDEGVKVEVHKLSLEVGDSLLLCSDGLTEMVSEKDVLAVLTAEGDPVVACDRLVDAANAAGGKDNVTVVVARFEA